MRELGLLADFDQDLGNQPGVLASLTYDYTGGDCPQLSIDAELDGVGLADSPGGTGRVDGGCQVGFFLTEPPPADEAESTLRFTDGTADASLTVERLLEHRSLVSSLSEGSVVATGDPIDFTWSVDSDEIFALDAFFQGGEETVQVEPRLDGVAVTVMVPSLTVGEWTLSLGVIADATVVACTGAPDCSAMVAGDGVLPVIVD